MRIGAEAIVFPFRSQVCNVSASFQLFSVVLLVNERARSIRFYTA